jgi:hypothetical protein
LLPELKYSMMNGLTTIIKISLEYGVLEELVRSLYSSFSRLTLSERLTWPTFLNYSIPTNGEKRNKII